MALNEDGREGVGGTRTSWEVGKWKDEWTGQIQDDNWTVFRMQKKFMVITSEWAQSACWGLFSTCMWAGVGAGAGGSWAVVLGCRHRAVDVGQWRVLNQSGSSP